ncbi:UNVERIFIED_CONTAM: hypothetical protein FKN15_028082 [Acipenser sinensis]
MPMKGRYPIRRTLEYLQKGDIVFKNTVKIMTVNYNTHGELSDGAREVLRAEELARMVHSNPANFGPKKYCLRECMCEVEGQVPCPGLIPLPNEMRGKYKSQMKGTEV